MVSSRCSLSLCCSAKTYSSEHHVCDMVNATSPAALQPREVVHRVEIGRERGGDRHRYVGAGCCTLCRLAEFDDLRCGRDVHAQMEGRTGRIARLPTVADELPGRDRLSRRDFYHREVRVHGAET